MFKIAIDASRYKIDKPTGVEVYSFNIINSLIKEFSKETEVEVDLLVKKGQKIDINTKNIKVKQVKGNRLWTLVHLSRFFLKNSYDLFFVPSHTFPLVLPKKNAIMIHDIAFMKFRSSYSLKDFLYLKLSTKFAIKKADLILVPSEATKTDLVKIFKADPCKIKVVYHGYKREVLDKKIENFRGFKDDNFFLFVGRIEKKKNLENIIRAFSKFKSKYQDYKLILAGKAGLGFEEIQDLIDKLNLKESVVVTGYISNEEKDFLYKYAKASILVSKYEGFGFPILESYSYKCPVLCGNTSSIPEVAGEKGVYVDPFNVEDIAKGLERLAKIDLSKEDKDFFKKQLAKFSWEKAGAKTFKYLKETYEQ